MLVLSKELKTLVCRMTCGGGIKGGGVLWSCVEVVLCSRSLYRAVFFAVFFARVGGSFLE